jgi:hypothetical protein
MNQPTGAPVSALTVPRRVPSLQGWIPMALTMPFGSVQERERAAASVFTTAPAWKRVKQSGGGSRDTDTDGTAGSPDEAGELDELQLTRRAAAQVTAAAVISRI